MLRGSAPDCRREFHFYRIAPEALMRCVNADDDQGIVHGAQPFAGADRKIVKYHAAMMARSSLSNPTSRTARRAQWRDSRDAD
jgi:hypothetical protein